MGKVICVGLGPGDPELMSVKADRLIRNAAHIAYFRKKGRKGQARQIVDDMLASDVTEYPMEYPVTTEISFESDEYNQALASFYDHWATRLIALAQDHDVIVLCEGDPFFYGSYMHLYTRIDGRAAQEVIPAILGMTGCWNAIGLPVTWGDDVLGVLMGTLPEEDIAAHVARSDALAIMKTGKNLPKIARVLEAAGRLDDAWLVKYGTMSNEEVQPLRAVNCDDCPYFATVIVHGQGRRP